MSNIPPKPTDKRTKAYKQWVAKYEKQSTGLGDTVEKITKATVIKKVVDNLFDALGKDCGCDKRKEILNKMFPYNKPNCLSEGQYNYLNAFFTVNNKLISLAMINYSDKYNSKSSSKNLILEYVNNIKVLNDKK